MKTIIKICLSVSFVCWLATVTAQTNAAAFSNLLVKGIRGSTVTVTINGAESGKVLAGLSKLITINKPGNLLVVLLDEQGNRFDTTILITDKDASKTVTVRFPDMNASVPLIAQAPQVEGSGEKDTDDDGVPDRSDREPNTPRNASVDVRGRSLDTDGDGVPDYKDKELFTQKNCFPVNNQGVGLCPEATSVKELYNTVMAMQAKIESFEKLVKPGSISSAPGISNNGMIDSTRRILNEMKNFVLQMQQQVAKARSEVQEAEQASNFAQNEAKEAEMASVKAQSEAQEAEQASTFAKNEAKEAEMASAKAQEEAKEAEMAAEKAKKNVGKTGSNASLLQKDPKKITVPDAIALVGGKTDTKEIKTKK